MKRWNRPSIATFRLPPPNQSTDSTHPIKASLLVLRLDELGRILLSTLVLGLALVVRLGLITGRLFGVGVGSGHALDGFTLGRR